MADERPLGRPLRILHVVGELNRGGIETWLMQILRTIDRNRFVLDFVVETADVGDYEYEALQLGSQIVRIGSRRSPKYGPRFRRVLRANGPYDVVHSHVNHYNGFIMRLARRARVPARIAHSHTDTTAKERDSGWMRRSGVRLMHQWIARHSTRGLAASVPAAISMFGRHWQQQGVCRVLHCGIDLSPFAEAYDRKAVREELRIPEEAWVIGHVGRMVDVKNHRLILDTFAEILPQADDVYLLLVGDGPLRGDLEHQARALGVFDRVRFAGLRTDIPRVLCGALNVFVFPSKFEGLGMALVEAQAAGLPCLVSDVVPQEADVVPELVTRLSLGESWVGALRRARHVHLQRQECLSRVQQSDFCIQKGVAALQRTYQESMGARQYRGHTTGLQNQGNK